MNKNNNNNSVTIDLECSEHKKVFEYICLKCNQLFCYRCANDHTKSHEKHHCDHADDIKSLLNKINKDSSKNNKDNISNNNSNKDNYIQTHIDSLWIKIKSSSHEIESLSQNIDTISNHFQQLHQYLIVEEHKLKKPIINVIDELRDEINQHLDQLKSIINIVDLYQHHYNQQQQQQQANNDNSSLEYIGNDDDITVQYSIESMIKSIQSSQTIIEFIDNNNKTIFNQHNNNNNMINYYKDNIDNIDSIILLLINNHNHKFQSKLNNISNNNTSKIIITNRYYNYLLSTNFKEDEINLFNQLIQQSINVSFKTQESTSTYIFKKDKIKDPKLCIPRSLDGQLYYFFKFVIVGDSNVGKSVMLSRLTNDKFDRSIQQTIGVNFESLAIEHESLKYKLQIWDTSGLLKFRTITSSYFKDTATIFIIYDVTNETSFKNVREWITFVNKYNEDAFKIIVGNKSDHPKRLIQYQQGRQLADELGLDFFETSAKTGQGLNDAFISIVDRLKHSILDQNGDYVYVNGLKKTNNNNNKDKSNHTKSLRVLEDITINRFIVRD
ncbi:ADP-ribosylation factor-related protein [Heterostelium album PN500]|uniref:ADP-ribosylation factor-related protein n=1 Tax=Heterostelium pallidum (strain ATCC 26659 / Pp 5 / PN500) TaxID=670386 RepID=D3BRH4_HETP5|nr:ADP-ribosylation factor-related protein [Heterostelium album PN500]EFA76006.1 ADP-ribosylation factor-related protein [Heterostelium album PN500]|eukprot:XP_020428140.1 ADP-ribosylation factor-related protein [Heterostelium album PN500]